jgi:DNA-binding transcriptional regulator YbjK
MSSTRDRIAAAALELLGTEGARALTHRRVDERAGLPEGSTSNHFRTRAALLAGATDAIVAAELPGVLALSVATPAELVDALATLVEAVTGPGRTVTTARHVVFLEAAHEPGLSAQLSASRAGYLAASVAALESLGAPESEAAAEALMALCEGLILHRIARHDASDPRPAIAIGVRGALG